MRILFSEELTPSRPSVTEQNGLCGHHEEPCAEIIKFAQAACRDDDEDGHDAPRCPVLKALRKGLLRKSDPFPNIIHLF